MTRANSSLHHLRGQAERIAKIVKTVERGENPIEDREGKIAAARTQDSVKFGVVMDDKVFTIELTWKSIRDTSEDGIAEYVLKLMQNKGEQQNG